MEAIEAADALAIMTEWGDYQRPELQGDVRTHALARSFRRPQSV